MDEDEHQIGYKVLPRGTPVEAADGEEVGRVDRALDNAREHIFDGIVIKTAAGKRFVDAPEVAEITNRRVRLTIGAGEVAELPEHRGVLGAVEQRAKRSAARWKRRLGR